MTITNKQAGLSLIELMLSIALGMLVVTIMLQILLSSKNTYRIQEGLARLQETARFSMHHLGTSIRMSGFQGCANSSNTKTANLIANPTTNMVWGSKQFIRGNESKGGSWLPNLPATIASRVSSESDVLTVRHAEAKSSPVTMPMADASDTLTVAARHAINPSDAVMITDCKNVDIFRAATGTTSSNITHDGPFNSHDNFSIAYGTDAHVARLRSFTYFVGDTGRQNLAGNPIDALYRVDIDGNVQELAEGVAGMQVLYAIDNDMDGSIDGTVTAEELNASDDWDKVRAVRVSLLITSVQDVATKPQPYTWQGQRITPNDRKLRRQWDRVISLRNL